MAAGRDWKSLSGAVVDRRSELGLTQAELASRVDGFSLKTLQRIEAGESVRPTTLSKLDRALGWKPGSARAIIDGGVATTADSGQTPVVDDNPFTEPHDRALYVMFRERLPELTREDWIFYVGAKRQHDEFQRLLRGDEERTTG